MHAGGGGRLLGRLLLRPRLHPPGGAGGPWGLSLLGGAGPPGGVLPFQRGAAWPGRPRGAPAGRPGGREGGRGELLETKSSHRPLG